MKTYFMKAIAVMFIAIAFSNSAAAQFVVKIRPAAHVIRVRPAAPSPRHVWVNGDYVLRGNQYVWTDGYWIQPRPHMRWVDGHWKNSRRGWVWVPGRWR
ncbi:MAG: hypothetical protein ABJA78_04635 [Ferruginibacter sp.]